MQLKESRIPREQLAEVAQVNQTVRQYLVELEQQNPTEEPVHEQAQVSTTDPDSTYATKGGTPARLGYYDNYLIDNHSCVIVGVQATAARMSQETVAAQDMLTRFTQSQGREPESVAADTTYGNGEFLQWLADRSITPYMRTRDSALRKNNPGYGPERFTYQPESNTYRCPAGEQLNYVGLNVRNRAHAYIGSAKRCGACSQKAQCTTGRYKYLAIHMHESVRQRARELAQTPEFAKAQRQRKKVEALFAELKNQIGLRRLRLRRMKFVREQFWLAATAQNIKRLVRFLSQPTAPLAVTTRNQRRTRSPYTTPQPSRAIRDFFNTHACLQQFRNDGSAHEGGLGLDNRIVVVADDPSLIPMKRGLLFQIGSVRRLLINDLLAMGNLKHGSVMCAHDHILMLLIRDPDGCT